MFIDEYSFGNQFNHKTRNQRKLLLNKKELNKLAKQVKNTGLTIIPLKYLIGIEIKIIPTPRIFGTEH